MKIQKGAYFLEWGENGEPFSLYTQSINEKGEVEKTFIKNSLRNETKEIINLINAYLLLTKEER